MNWRPFSYDPVSGIRREFAYDHSTKEAVIRTTMDVDPLLDDNARLRNDGTGGWSQDRAMRRIAEIPMHVLCKWAEEWGMPGPHGEEFDLKLIKRMNDRDFYKLRTSEGGA